MSLLITAVVLYMVCTVAIGLYAARRVHGSKDFMVAGRSLPLYMNFACVFATWFGAETLLSVSAAFANDGLEETAGDPFGASVCLALVALFFARAFYRMDLLTIGDFYHKRFGKVVEVLTSLAITISYLGWTSAQMTALGLVIWVLGAEYFGPDGLNSAILLGAGIVFVYTVFGGMWSVALTDVIQTAAIVLGLIVVAVFLSSQAGGVSTVIETAHANGKLHLFPHGDASTWWAWGAAFITFALGSIPQQDIFQRVTSAKDERTAVTGTLLGGSFYFLFAFVPMFIAYSAVVIDPDLYTQLFADAEQASRESQRIIPDLVLLRTPVWCQILFFGALLSAILSTASGTILAPSSLFTENVLRPFVRKMTDQGMLWTLRGVMAFFSLCAVLFAISTDDTMHEMVENAYKVTLTMAFVPLAAGVYWKRSTTQGALASNLLGLGVWVLAEFLSRQELNLTEANSPLLWHFSIVPPQIYGLVASAIGMFVGSLAPQIIPQAVPDELAFERPTTVSH